MSTEVEKSLVENERLDSMKSRQLSPTKEETPKPYQKTVGRSTFAPEAAQEIDTEGAQEDVEAEFGRLSIAPVPSTGAVRKTSSALIKQTRAKKKRDIPVDIMEPQSVRPQRQVIKII